MLDNYDGDPTGVAVNLDLTPEYAARGLMGALLVSFTLMDDALYQQLLKSVQTLGPFQEEVKKTSIHLVRASAFAGVHPRRHHLLLTIKAASPIASTRIVRSEQISKNRWHLDVKLTSTEEIDAELLAWLRDAYALCS